MKFNIRNLPNKNGVTYPIYDIITKSGFTLSILSLGASIQKIAFSDRGGQEVSIALGFPAADPYEKQVCYAGATLGPNAGRIRDARLPVWGACYSLSRNEHLHQLHGGIGNLSA